MKIRDRLSAAFAAIAGRNYESGLHSIIERLQRENFNLEKRYFEGASQDRLKADWGTTVTSADAELRNDLGALRSRWRELERDNGLGARYLRLLEKNILGPDGIQLHMHIVDPNGSLDTKASEQIEADWLEWGKKKNCTITGLYSWDQVCRLALRSVARDGSVLIQKVIGSEAGNAWGFALKPMEGDHLDRFYSGYAPNGNEVRLGVEFDRDSVGQKRKPVAYWITPRHPGDFIGYSGNYTRRRVPASEVIHLYDPTRFEQSEGVPWGTAAMSGLHNRGKYSEAEMVAARMGACVQDYIKLTTGEEYQGDAKDANGQPLTDMQPGAIKVLPKGADVVSNDPKHPNQAFGEFMKAQTRDAACGLDVDYNSLANDLESVNYSSIRAGMLDTRDSYKVKARWFVENMVQEVFDAYMPMAFLSGRITLPFSKFDKFNKPTWKSRAWDWVDPLKDIQAMILAINNYLASPQSIIAERGGDASKILREIEEWHKMIAKAKLPPPGQQQQTKPAGEKPEGKKPKDEEQEEEE